MQALGFTDGQFWAAMLLLVRVGSIFAFIPPFSHPLVPRRVKGAAALVITVSLAYAGVSGSIPPPGGVIEMTLMVMREAAIGMMLGIIMQVLFLAVLFGGQVLGIQMGLNAASIMDPMLQSSVADISYIYYYCALLLFFSVGGDRMVIEALVGNLRQMPLGQAHVPPSAVKALIEWTGEIFSTGFSLAAPMLAALFATTLLLGILARSVPQLNMLMLGYSLKIIVGLLVASLIMPAWADAFLRFMSRALFMFQNMGRLMGSG